jgi:hypothetical protein
VEKFVENAPPLGLPALLRKPAKNAAAVHASKITALFSIGYSQYATRLDFPWYFHAAEFRAPQRERVLHKD